MMHPCTLFKVRLYKSKLRSGKWVAVWVEDTAPAKDGCRQTPIKYLRPAYGTTPGMAYLNLTRSQA